MTLSFATGCLATIQHLVRLRAQRATAPLGLASFDQVKVQEALGNTPRCKATLTCALNSCRVVFATAGMLANRHKLLLGAAPRTLQTRFAVSFVDEASRHSIPAGLDLSAMGSQCLLCGDHGQLRPYSHVHLLASACEGAVQATDVAWPSDRKLSYNNLHAICWPACALA